MSNWRPAKAIATLKKQVNAAWPDRPKDSDGIIGDASHSARTSDHNPNDAGVVCAFDITDPHGKPFEARDLIKPLLADTRTHYVIHEDTFYHRGKAPAPYNGSSPHTEHLHLSLVQDAALYDDPREWKNIGPKEAPVAADTSWAFGIEHGGNNSDLSKMRRAAESRGNVFATAQVPQASYTEVDRIAKIVSAYCNSAVVRAGIDTLVK